MMISIVGGGATGCAILIALLKEMRKHPPSKKIQINIFEYRSIGRGLVYADLDDRFLLNTSVCLTSVDSTDPLDFFKWLKRNEDLWKKKYPEIQNYDEDSFLPRSLAGLYLESTLKNELALMNSSRIEIRQIRERVNDIHYHYDEHCLTVITQFEKY